MVRSLARIWTPQAVREGDYYRTWKDKTTIASYCCSVVDKIFFLTWTSLSRIGTPMYLCFLAGGEYGYWRCWGSGEMTHCSTLLGSGETDYSRSPKPETSKSVLQSKHTCSSELLTGYLYKLRYLKSCECRKGVWESWQLAASDLQITQLNKIQC